MPTASVPPEHGTTFELLCWNRKNQCSHEKSNKALIQLLAATVPRSVFIEPIVNPAYVVVLKVFVICVISDGGLGPGSLSRPVCDCDVALMGLVRNGHKVIYSREDHIYKDRLTFACPCI